MAIVCSSQSTKQHFSQEKQVNIHKHTPVLG